MAWSRAKGQGLAYNTNTRKYPYRYLHHNIRPNNTESIPIWGTVEDSKCTDNENRLDVVLISWRVGERNTSLVIYHENNIQNTSLNEQRQDPTNFEVWLVQKRCISFTTATTIHRIRLDILAIRPVQSKLHWTVPNGRQLPSFTAYQEGCQYVCSHERDV